MPVTAVRKDPGALTLTLDAELDASAERVWQLWADPRRLERWWGPPTSPATVEAHDLRDGDRVFLTYTTTGRGNERANGSLGLLDMTPCGRREGWEDTPEGWPEAPQADDAPVGGHGAPICWSWRTDAAGVASWGPTSRPVPQWTRPGATPVETLGRHGPHH